MYDLRWADLAPSTHAFDTRRSEPAVRSLVEEAARRSHRNRTMVEHAINDALIAEYGEWASGWRWCATEGGGGGPVRGWCCSSHSVLPDREHGPEATIARVVAAVADWRGYLEELEKVFAELRAETSDLSIERRVEHAAARLMPIVLDRTNAEDAWYRTFARTLAWYLEEGAYEIERVRDAVDSVINGRFQSWTAPTTEEAQLTFAELATSVAASDATQAPHDALAEWIAIRRTAFHLLVDRGNRAITFDSIGEPVVDDGHERFIERVDRAREPARADRMAAALVLCRDSALRSQRLSLGQLAEWQAVVLDHRVPVELRTTPAHAKHGRETYSIGPELRETFEAALEDANDPKQPAPLRAARVYLDVCFFHPFDDGNGRAARLALDHVLTSAGLALRAAEPLFLLSRAANDARGAGSFAWLIARLSGPRA